ncbi:MAG: TRAP transporter permease [Alphaproteobacteria bacterium]|nr:TRAP transporter permease [Alphaproteobacteria bacterium]MBU0798199.1 TRAP transporter permease [Alphaproteobacteria bacterium]MBU0887583.1 TRAP transporter permease [Alphaproteobacteria bacterium]MBU1814234.1 TRAP transporter permease [Alphaproteobacteria bacterium]
MSQTDKAPALAASDPAYELPEEEFGGYKRPLRPWEAKLFYMLCVGFTAFHLIVLNFYPIDPWLFRSIHVSWGAVIGFAIFRFMPSERRIGIPWFDWVLMAAAIGVCLYMFVELDDIQFRAGALYTTGDVITGLAGTLIVLEMTRRTAGWALTIIALVFILYAFVGPWMPGVLYHRGYGFQRFITYIYSDQGILGSTVAVSSTYIILFVAFGAFLQVSKVGDYFNDLSMAMFGWSRGGPAKATVISGILFGTISGSSVGNVVASGAFTIPMMRRVGYDRATAAAVEATSSTGGQITPPVLGAGAFIMAEITGIPYGDIAMAAIIPCLLFYVACFMHVELHARKYRLDGLPFSELPKLGDLLMKAYLFIPVVVLVWTLLAGYSPFRAGSLGIVSAIVVSWLSRHHRVGPREAIEGLNKAARDVIQLVAVCAAAGIIVGVIALTGIGGRFSALILGLAGTSQFLAMVFAMLIAMILGMGMPTTAAYAIGASVVAPGLQRMGVEPLVAHLFIFYYAVISAITPPVALASFAAAGMAQADPWKTSFIALKMGLATFIVPFMFFYSPLLLGQGEIMSVIYVTLTASLGVIALACATEGWLFGLMPRLMRIVMFAAAIMLIVPEPITDGIGFVIAAGIAIFQWVRRVPEPAREVVP